MVETANDQITGSKSSGASTRPESDNHTSNHGSRTLPTSTATGNTAPTKRQNTVVNVTSVMLSTSGKGTPAGLHVSYLPLLTFEWPENDFQTFLTKTKLEDVRVKISKQISSQQSFRFCTDECSVVAETMSLGAYRKMLHRRQQQTEHAIDIYVAASEEPDVSQGAAILRPPFMLKFLKLSENQRGDTNVGSLHSAAFKGKGAASLPLSELRKLISKMSSDPHMHVFCTADGTVAGDTLTLAEYLNLDSATVPSEKGIPTAVIRFRSAKATIPARGLGSDHRFDSQSNTAGQSHLHGRQSSGAATNRIEGGNRASSGGFDGQEESGQGVHDARSRITEAMERIRPDLSMEDRVSSGLQFDTSEFKVQEQLDASQFAATEANPVKVVTAMDESDWDAVLRNGCLFYGWTVNMDTHEIERAETPAFRLRSTRTKSTPPARPVAQPATAKKPMKKAEIEDENYDPLQESETEEPEADEEKYGSALLASELDVPETSKLGAIPSYAIADQSRIEISVAEHQLQESMARNHFSATSFEASISGGTKMFSAGASGGFNSEEEKQRVEQSKTHTKIMVGTYKFPRVTVFLRPEDMEPTPELREAIETVKRTKNINDLRYLNSTFGLLFSRTVTVGGCLQTTKTVTGMEKSTEGKSRDAFKAQIGVAFSSPFVEAEAKHSHEKQEGAADQKKVTDTREAMLFEATGGNTILAANPPLWSSSVADFNNWRVIDQKEIRLLVDILFQIKGYEEVKTWFYQAVPMLNQYAVIPQERALWVRFKCNPVANKLQSFLRDRPHYLAHHPSKAPKPVRTSIHKMSGDTTKTIFVQTAWGASGDITVTHKMTETVTSDALFYPFSTQAPVLFLLNQNDAGTVKDPNLLHTIWRLEVAQGDSIGADTKLCIKSRTHASMYTMVVYRNQQGLFMPAMSNTDEPCFWRLERAAEGARDTRFQYGERFRLTWRFSDQSGGYRDYTDDTYGRRNFNKPADIKSDVLYMKVPFPCFDSPKKDTGISLVMTPFPLRDPVLASMTVLAKQGESKDPKFTYSFHDLAFRMDFVGNNGLGDAADFMNVVTPASEKDIKEWVTTEQKKFAPPPPLNPFFGPVGAVQTIGHALSESVGAVSSGFRHLGDLLHF